MDFDCLKLPEKELFQTAFAAGWRKYLELFMDDEAVARNEYMRGPAAMARLIHERGGDCRQVAVAACLAGPALFSNTPESGMDRRLMEFRAEVQSVETTLALDVHGLAARLSGDARLFLQVSAVMLLERLASHDDGLPEDERQRNYYEAVELYSVVRGARDVYGLDIAFEVAALKVQDVFSNKIQILDALRQQAQRVGFM